MLVLFGYMNFSSFLIYYMLIYGLICLFLLLQLVTSGEFKWTGIMKVTREQKREFLRYGFYTMLAGTPWVLIQKIDLNILSHYALPAVLGGYYLRSEEHTSELQSLMRISYAVFCLKKKKNY